jgi:hypothetical protein
LNSVNLPRALAPHSSQHPVDCDTLLPETLTCEPPIPGSPNCLTVDPYGKSHTVSKEQLFDRRVNVEVFRFQQACRLRELLPDLGSQPAAPAPPSVGTPAATRPQPAPTPRSEPWPFATAPATGPQAAAELRAAIDPSAFRRLGIDRLVTNVNTELAMLRPKLQLRQAQLNSTACIPLTQRQEASVGAWIKAADNLNEWVDAASSKIKRFNGLPADEAEPIQLLQLKSVIEGVHAQITQLDAGDNELDKALRNVWPSYPGGSGSNPIFRALPVSPAAQCQSLAPGEHRLPPDIPRVDRAPTDDDADVLRAIHRADSAQIVEWQAGADERLADLVMNLEMLGEAFKVASGVDYRAALSEIQARVQVVMESREAIMQELQGDPDYVVLLRRQQSADQEALGLISVQMWLDQSARDTMKKWLDSQGQVTTP